MNKANQANLLNVSAASCELRNNRESNSGTVLSVADVLGAELVSEFLRLRVFNGYKKSNVSREEQSEIKNFYKETIIN